MISHIMSLVYEAVYRLSQNRLTKVSGCHIDRKIAGSRSIWKSCPLCKLHAFKERMMKHAEYYNSNQLITAIE